LAAQALKSAEPNGNTLLLTPDAIIAVAPHTYSKLPYNPLEDFVAIAHSGTFEYGLVVGAGSPLKDFRDWVTSVKANPKVGSYATTGLGTGPHFVGMMMAQATGLPLQAIAYKGVAPATTDVIGGQVPAAILPFGQLDSFIKGGKVRVLAHTGEGRASFAPDVPTFKELGYPAVELIGWYGIFAPAQTSPEIVSRYNAIINRALSTAEVREKMESLGLGVKRLTAGEMGAMVRAEHTRWRNIVRSTGYSAETK